jgi:hypothetical protein
MTVRSFVTTIHEPDKNNKDTGEKKGLPRVGQNHAENSLAKKRWDESVCECYGDNSMILISLFRTDTTNANAIFSTAKKACSVPVVGVPVYFAIIARVLDFHETNADPKTSSNDFINDAGRLRYSIGIVGPLTSPTSATYKTRCGP